MKILLASSEVHPYSKTGGLADAVGALTAALAFYKQNGKTFVQIAQAAIGFQLSKKLYLWRKEEKPAASSAGPAVSSANSLYIPKLSDSKLKDLAWSLDVLDFKKGESN